MQDSGHLQIAPDPGERQARHFAAPKATSGENCERTRSEAAADPKLLSVVGPPGCSSIASSSHNPRRRVLVGRRVWPSRLTERLGPWPDIAVELRFRAPERQTPNRAGRLGSGLAAAAHADVGPVGGAVGTGVNLAMAAVRRARPSRACSSVFSSTQLP